MKTACLLALALVFAAPGPVEYRAEIEKYRAARVAELTAPDGWLAVRGLFWLHEGANTAGSDSVSEIKLPPRTAKRVGIFTIANGQTTFTADASAHVTSDGKETYEAGRFLHTPLPRDGVVDLDFNRAYNPPCAFTEFATCPLPIKENQLNVRILAGELRFHLPPAR